MGAGFVPDIVKQPADWTGKIFNPEMRSYFDIDSETVKNKIFKLLMPFKTFSFEYVHYYLVIPLRS